MGDQKFVKAHAYEDANRGAGDIKRIVVHTAEIQEHRDSAEDIADYFAKPTTDVSAHRVVDNNTVVACVRDEDIAYHAKGDNLETKGYELSGFAKQSFAQWRDDYSRAVIENAAQEMAKDCLRHDIPRRFLTPDLERKRVKGFVTHAVVSAVFGEGIRSDPGAEFPKQLLLNRVEFHMRQLTEIEFVLTDEPGSKVLVQSASTPNVLGERRERLEAFLANHVPLIDRELEEDRDVVVRRRKAT